MSVVTRADVKIALGGPDIAKWAAQRVTGHGFDPNLNIGEGIFITGSSTPVYVNRSDGPFDEFESGLPYLDPDSYVDFMLAGGSWSRDLDYDDTTKLGAMAMGLMEDMATKYEEIEGDAQIGTIAIVVEVTGDTWTSVDYRCTDGRRFVQDGLFSAARRAVFVDSQPPG